MSEVTERGETLVLVILGKGGEIRSIALATFRANESTTSSNFAYPHYQTQTHSDIGPVGSPVIDIGHFSLNTANTDEGRIWRSTYYKCAAVSGGHFRDGVASALDVIFSSETAKHIALGLLSQVKRVLFVVSENISTSRIDSLCQAWAEPDPDWPSLDLAGLSEEQRRTFYCRLGLALKYGDNFLETLTELLPCEAA